MYLELKRNWLFQFHDEPNLYIGNGWKSPNSKHPFLTGCSGFQLETQQLDLRFRPNDRGAHQQQCPGRYQPRLSKDFLRKKKRFSSQNFKGAGLKEAEVIFLVALYVLIEGCPTPDACSVNIFITHNISYTSWWLNQPI